MGDRLDAEIFLFRKKLPRVSEAQIGLILRGGLARLLSEDATEIIGVKAGRTNAFRKGKVCVRKVLVDLPFDRLHRG